MSSRRLVFLVVALCCAYLTPSAAAATQIGTTFLPDQVGGCPNDGVYLASGTPGEYAAPFSGVITSWSYQAGGVTPQIRLKVARATAPNNFSIVGHSELRPTVANTLNTFPTRISVNAQDVIGFYTATGGACAVTAAGYGYHFLDTADPAPGSGGMTYQPFNDDVKFDLSASLEPDADQDGFGDETQDRCLGKPGSINGCPPATKCKKKKKKGKKGAAAAKKKKKGCKKKKKKK